MQNMNCDFKGKTLVTAAVCFFLLGLTGNVHAIDKMKIAIEPFANPIGWDNPYSPASTLTSLVRKAVRDNPNLILTAKPNKMAPAEDIEKSVLLSRLGKSSAQTIIRGRIIDFQPDKFALGQNPATLSESSEHAELNVEVEWISKYTDRVIDQKVIRAVSVNGVILFDSSADSSKWQHPDFGKSSMGQAMAKMARDVALNSMEKLAQIPADAEIIAINNAGDAVLINVGRQSGVEVQDTFKVYSVSMNVSDPFNHSDLGDRFIKRGVVRIMTVQEDFSEAVILAGESFKKGDLARTQYQVFIKKAEGQPEVVLSSSSELPPDRRFIGFNRGGPPKTWSGFDFFSIFGWSLTY